MATSDTTTKTQPKKKLTQEQRDEYNRRRRNAYRERKKQRKEEKDNNTYTERRLHFIRVIMQQRHISQTKLADKMGITRQAINWMFSVTDDMHLKMIKRVLDICDCTCTVEIVPMETERIQRKATYEFKGNFKPTGLNWDTTPAEFLRYPEAIENCPPKANLKFLADFIIATNLSVTEFCEKVKTSRQNIAYAFSVDDIRLSTLCQIANLSQAKLVWEINEKEPVEVGENLK